MEKSKFIFLKKLIVFSLLLLIPVLTFYYAVNSSFVSPSLPYLIPFFFSITYLTYVLIYKYIQSKVTKFVNFYLVATMLKLLLYLAVLLVYSLIYRNDAVNFIISFFVIYLFYTAFEIVGILSLNSDNRNNK